MADLDLTDKPLTLSVSLTRGSDFHRVIEAVDGTFAEGTEVTLDFGVTSWPAVVTPTEVSWDRDKAVVDAVIVQGPEEAVLRYKLGDVDRVWATGPVIVYG